MTHTFQQATVSSSLKSPFFTIHVYKCTRIRVQVEPKCFEFQFRTHSNFKLCMHQKFDRFQWLESCKQTLKLKNMILFAISIIKFDEGTNSFVRYNEEFVKSSVR